VRNRQITGSLIFETLTVTPDSASGPSWQGFPGVLLQELSSFAVAAGLIFMGKKNSNVQTTKAAAKAAKKARAAQKTERKEKKKQGKAKDEFDDDQDLEAILENVSEHSVFTLLVQLTETFPVDSPRVGGVSCCNRGTCRRSTKPESERDPHGVSLR